MKTPSCWTAADPRKWLPWTAMKPISAIRLLMALSVGWATCLFLVKLDTPALRRPIPRPRRAPVTEPVNLFPSDLKGATGSNATAVYEGETLKVTSTAADATFTFPVGKEYNISKLPSMFFTVDAEVGFDIRVNYTGTTSRRGRNRQ